MGRQLLLITGHWSLIGVRGSKQREWDRDFYRSTSSRGAAMAMHGAILAVYTHASVCMGASLAHAERLNS